MIVRAEPPPALTRAFDQLQGDRLRALLIAIAIGILVGFIVSSLIAIRVKRLARAAEQMARGGSTPAFRREGRDRRPDPLARHDAGGAPSYLLHAGHRAGQALSDLRWPDRGW